MVLKGVHEMGEGGQSTRTLNTSMAFENNE
jgi:hypothetical protein